MTQDEPIEMSKLDDLSRRLRQEALDAMEEEPQLTMLLKNTVLAPGVQTFEDAVASTITYRMLLKPCNNPAAATATTMMFCPNSLHGILADALQSTDALEAGHTMAQAVRLDALAVCDRDPAVDSLLEVVLFLKGFAALVAHRAAHAKWHAAKAKGKKSLVALWLQSQASAVFGLDIHPGATMGAGIMLDHGTGIVIGETAAVGDGCTLLHGVTLGGTGKESGDRHPKVGKDVLIGANASLLGNIPIGDGAKIGAGSIVLGSIPSGATAVGAPAKIVGRAKEAKPASTMDETLQQVSYMHKSESLLTVSTASMTSEEAPVSDEETSKDGNDIKEITEKVANSTKEPDKTGHETNNQNNNKQHPRAIQRKDSNTATNCCCPFRDYLVLAQSAPKDGITIVTMRHLLKPLGCTFDEIGAVLFALDKRDVGYVKPRAFFTQETEDVLLAKTKLSAEQVKACLSHCESLLTNGSKTLENGVTITPSPQGVSAAC